jgi:hypothetical protein
LQYLGRAFFQSSWKLVGFGVPSADLAPFALTDRCSNASIGGCGSSNLEQISVRGGSRWADQR